MVYFLLLVDWSVSDKKRLLLALKQCGTKDISKIQQLLPEKTITDIRLAFETYSRLANEKKSIEKESQDDSAINQWIKIVEKNQERSHSVVDIVPRVLKYIALFEKRPNNTKINLKDCYLALSYLTGDMNCRKLNEATSNFFFENLSNLALKIKKEDKTSRTRFIQELKNLDQIVKPQIVKTYNRKKRKINTILNPLNVPDNLLKINNETI